MIGFALRIGIEIARGVLGSKDLVKGGKNMIVEARAWPMDCDIFFHLNNASYARMAELARWRSLGASGMLNTTVKNRWAFLIAEQSLVYRRQIPLMSKFKIETAVAASDSKWFHYTHHFVSPDEKVHFATARVKAVFKRPTGKTVTPEEIAMHNDWLAAQLAHNKTVESYT